jgi:hypothetical protein
MTGSTREARSAGTQLATIATPPSTATAHRQHLVHSDLRRDVMHGTTNRGNAGATEEPLRTRAAQWDAVLETKRHALIGLNDR